MTIDSIIIIGNDRYGNQWPGVLVMIIIEQTSDDHIIVILYWPQWRLTLFIDDVILCCVDVYDRHYYCGVDCSDVLFNVYSQWPYWRVLNDDDLMIDDYLLMMTIIDIVIGIMTWYWLMIGSNWRTVIVIVSDYWRWHVVILTDIDIDIYYCIEWRWWYWRDIVLL